MSCERSRWDADWVTCGAERDERQRVLADHRQLIFGQGQPVYDVLYEVVGDDRGHVPPQLSQDDQFPVLQRQRSKKKKKKRCCDFPCALRTTAASGCLACGQLKGTQREPSLLMGVLPWPR